VAMPDVRAPLARFTPFAPGALLLLVLILFAGAQAASFYPAYSEPDIDGYVWLAKRIAAGGPVTAAPETPFRYHEHFWVQRDDGRVTVKYPPGWPAMLAVAWHLAGDRGMYALSIGLAVAALVGTFLLVARWGGPWLGLGGATVLAANPLLLFHGGYLLAHVPNLALAAFGGWWLWRWADDGRRPDAIGAGLALGLAVLVRPTSLLLVAPILVAAAWRAAPRAGRRRELGRSAWLLGAWLLGPLLLAGWNQAVFGSPARTGYEMTGEQSRFTAAHLARHLPAALYNANEVWLPFLAPLLVVGLLAAGRARDRAMRAAWILPVALLYCAYYWFVPTVSWYRFWMVLLPPAIGAALLIAGELRARRRTRAVAGVLLVAGAIAGGAGSLAQAAHGRLRAHPSGPPAEAAALLAAHLPAETVLFLEPPFYHCLAYRRRYEGWNLAAFSAGYGRRALGPWADRHNRHAPRPDGHWRARLRRQYAALGRRERSAARHRLVAGALAGNRTVAVFLPAGRPPGEAVGMVSGWRWERLATFDPAFPRWSRAPAAWTLWRLRR